MRKTTTLSTSVMGALLLLLTLPAAAQQDHDAHHPGGAAAAQAAPPAAQPPSGVGPRGGPAGPAAPGSGPGAGPMGGRGMMMGPNGGMAGGPGMGPGMMGMSDEGERRRMMMIHHRAADGPPMNVIINIGPGIRVEAEEGDDGRGGRQGRGMVPPGGAGMMGSGMMGMMMGPGMMGQHVEGRIAFLRAELGITEAQAQQWDAFAEALRANARAMAELHQQMMPMMQGGPQTTPLPQRLELHERMMTSHLEALRRVRAAAGPLYAVLDDRQKRIADGLMMGMM